MMRHATTFCRRNLRRRDLNALINLDGIAVDDLAVETQRQLNSERALAGRSRPDDGDDVTQTVSLRLLAIRVFWLHDVANSQFALPRDHKPNRDHEPDDGQQHNRADDLIA